LNKVRATTDIKDPLDNISYTYSVNSLKTRYQLLSMLENKDNLAINDVISNTYAIDYKNRYPYAL
jgi:hypothetical protein